jgi:hypothetical protein
VLYEFSHCGIRLSILTLSNVYIEYKILTTMLKQTGFVFALREERGEWDKRRWCLPSFLSKDEDKARSRNVLFIETMN